MPSSVTFEQAAAVSDGACIALACLQKADLEGERIVVYGASGSIGTAAVQLAKSLRRAGHGRLRHRARRARPLAGRR